MTTWIPRPLGRGIHVVILMIIAWSTINTPGLSEKDRGVRDHTLLAENNLLSVIVWVMPGHYPQRITLKIPHPSNTSDHD